MTPSPCWSEVFARLSEVKTALERADRKRIYRHLPPNSPASDAQLAAAEQAIGEPLDAQYREFLTLAGGWPAVLQDIDLLGAADFLGSAAYLDAQQRLGWMVEEDHLAPTGFTLSELLPIAVSAHDRDLFVMVRRTSKLAGTVIWLSGYEVERYPDFASFFDAIVAYNEQVIASMTAQTSA